MGNYAAENTHECDHATESDGVEHVNSDISFGDFSDISDSCVYDIMFGDYDDVNFVDETMTRDNLRQQEYMLMLKESLQIIEVVTLIIVSKVIIVINVITMKLMIISRV